MSIWIRRSLSSSLPFLCHAGTVSRLVSKLSKISLLEDISIRGHKRESVIVVLRRFLIILSFENALSQEAEVNGIVHARQRYSKYSGFDRYNRLRSFTMKCKSEWAFPEIRSKSASMWWCYPVQPVSHLYQKTLRINLTNYNKLLKSRTVRKRPPKKKKSPLANSQVGTSPSSPALATPLYTTDTHTLLIAITYGLIFFKY